MLAINPEVIDAKSVKDFIAKVKAAPGKYNYASTGNGTGTHLAFAEFNAKAGLDMVHVPYKGGPDAIQARAERRRLLHLQPGADRRCRTSAPGKVRLLGVTTKKRVAAIPDVPTIDEAGVPGYESYTWFAHLRAQGPRSGDRAEVQRRDQGWRWTIPRPRRSWPSSATRRATRRSSSSRRR